MDYVELEIGLQRREADTYSVEMRLSEPNSDGDIRLTRNTLKGREMVEASRWAEENSNEQERSFFMPPIQNETGRVLFKRPRAQAGSPRQILSG